jgi:hypothetical protein
VLEAVACLKANPAAGSSVTSQFKQQQAALISTDADIALAFDGLERQKNRRMYVRIQGLNEGQARLMVVEAATIGGQSPATVYDLSALDLTFTHASATFGADKIAALEKVSSFLYVEKSRGTGELKTGFRDDTYLTDSTYKGVYPIKVAPGAYGLQEIKGTVYPGKILNKTWKLDTANLSGFIVTFFTEEKGKSLVAKLDEEFEVRQKAKDQADRAAAAQRQAELAREQEAKATALKEMGKMPIGSEDSCRRVGFAAVADSDFAPVECQFSGKVNLNDLKSAGWLIVNKQRDSDNVVREYYIRKVR